jgi:hypothetical protein
MNICLSTNASVVTTRAMKTGVAFSETIHSQSTRLGFLNRPHFTRSLNKNTLEALLPLAIAPQSCSNLVDLDRSITNFKA